MVSRIIQPKAKPLKKIEIELDANNQADVKGTNMLTGGPLHPFDVILNLMQIATSMLSGLIDQRPPTVREGLNNATKKESD